MLFITFTANMSQHTLMSNNNLFDLEEPEVFIYKKILADAYCILDHDFKNWKEGLIVTWEVKAWGSFMHTFFYAQLFARNLFQFPYFKKFECKFSAVQCVLREQTDCFKNVSSKLLNERSNFTKSKFCVSLFFLKNCSYILMKSEHLMKAPTYSMSKEMHSWCFSL